MIFNAGDRVIAPGGSGAVVYRRMKSFDCSQVHVYSVRLDSRSKNDLSYEGTFYLVYPENSSNTSVQNTA